MAQFYGQRHILSSSTTSKATSRTTGKSRHAVDTVSMETQADHCAVNRRVEEFNGSKVDACRVRAGDRRRRPTNRPECIRTNCASLSLRVDKRPTNAASRPYVFCSLSIENPFIARRQKVLATQGLRRRFGEIVCESNSGLTDLGTRVRRPGSDGGCYSLANFASA